MYLLAKDDNLPKKICKTNWFPDCCVRYIEEGPEYECRGWEDQCGLSLGRRGCPGGQVRRWPGVLLLKPKHECPWRRLVLLTNSTIQVQIHVYQGEDEENRGYSEGLEGYSDSSQGMPDLEYRCCYKLAIIQLAKIGETETIMNIIFRSQESGQQDLVSLALQSSKVAIRLIMFTLYLIFWTSRLDKKMRRRTGKDWQRGTNWPLSRERSCWTHPRPPPWNSQRMNRWTLAVAKTSLTK